MIERDKLINFICENFMVEENEIDCDSSLVDQGIIDSFGLIEISAFIESEFGIETSTEQMNKDNFGSVNKILEYIKSN